MSSDWKNSLAYLLPPHQIRTDAEALKTYSKDWTTYFETRASAVLFPESTEQVKKIVDWARQSKTSLVPSGGRTGLSGAACALNGEVIVSFDRMNQILDFDPVDSIVRIQAGVITETLQNFAKDKGLYYPVDFAARGSSQMGGTVATNAGGIRVIRYGMTRSWIAGLEVVTGAGDILNLNQGLIKNATGYDLRQLFIGSEGTLGFITEILVQLTKKPAPSQVLLLALPKLQAVMEVLKVFSQKTNLTAFEMFSDLALSHVMDRAALSQPFEQRAPFYVVLESEIPDESALTALTEAFEGALEKSWITDGILAQSEAQAQNLWKYREQISESISYRSPYKNDISVRPALVPQFIEKLEAVLQKAYPTWEVVWFGHIGDGNLHVNILKPEGMTKEIFVHECRKVDSLVFETVQSLQGSISAEHGVGLTKKDFLQFTRSAPEISLMRQIKTAFDPDGIINPGKVF